MPEYKSTVKIPEVIKQGAIYAFIAVSTVIGVICLISMGIDDPMFVTGITVIVAGIMSAEIVFRNLGE